MIFSSLKLSSSEAIYTQLEKHVIHAIENGELKKNNKLPSTREVSSFLGVSRNSVIAAYEILEDKGYIKTEKGKGTFVNKEGEKKVYEYKVNWEQCLNKYSTTLREKDVIKSEPKFEKGMISFKSIAPEGDLFNLEDFKRALLDSWNYEEVHLLNYGYAKGYQPLINYLIKYMEEKGVDSKNKDILISNGFTEGFDIILASLSKPGDIIFCEEPTNNTALKVMEGYGLKIIGIEMDKDGMIIKDLEDKLLKYSPKFLYTIPTYNNPTGIVTKRERREEIYKICRKNLLPIIENGFNEELLYSTSPLEPIASLSGEGNGVIYIGSLSKVLFPGLRIGWIMGDRNLIDILESVKRGRSIHSSFLDQSIMYYYLKSGAFNRYIKNIRKHYKKKYLKVMDEVNKYIPYEELTGEGGLYIYIKLKKNISSRELLNLCVKEGVLFMPGDLFSPQGKGESSFRLAFGRVNNEEIEKGIKIIGNNIKILAEKVK